MKQETLFRKKSNIELISKKHEKVPRAYFEHFVIFVFDISLSAYILYLLHELVFLQTLKFL